MGAGWRCLRQFHVWKGCLEVLEPRSPVRVSQEWPCLSVPAWLCHWLRAAKGQEWHKDRAGFQRAVSEARSQLSTPCSWTPERHTVVATTLPYVCSSPKSGFSFNPYSCAPTGKTHQTREGVGSHPRSSSTYSWVFQATHLTPQFPHLKM